MTITTSIDEIKDYEKRCNGWMMDRMKYAVSILTISGNSWEPRTTTILDEKLMDRWDREHPYPKLVPSV